MEDTQFYEWTQYQIKLIDTEKLLLDTSTSSPTLLQKIESFLPSRIESLITKRTVRIFQLFFFKLVDLTKKLTLPVSINPSSNFHSIDTLNIQDIRPKISNQQATFLHQNIYDQFQQIQQLYSSPQTRSLPLTYQQEQQIKFQLDTMIQTLNVESTIVQLQQIHTNFQSSKNEMMIFLNNIESHVRKVRKIEVEHNINGQLESMREEKQQIIGEYQKKLWELVRKIKKQLVKSYSIIDRLRNQIKGLNPEKSHCYTQTTNVYIHDLERVKRREEEVYRETERLKKLIEQYDKMNRAIKYEIEENKISYVEERSEEARVKKEGGKLGEIKEDELNGLNLSNLVDNIQQMESFVGKASIKKLSRYAKQVVTNTLDSLIKNINQPKPDHSTKPKKQKQIKDTNNKGQFSWPKGESEMSVSVNVSKRSSFVQDGTNKGSEEEIKSNQSLNKILPAPFQHVSPNRKVSRKESMFGKKISMSSSMLLMGKEGGIEQKERQKQKQKERQKDKEKQAWGDTKQNKNTILKKKLSVSSQNQSQTKQQKDEQQLYQIQNPTQQHDTQTSPTKAHLPSVKTVSTFPNNITNKLDQIQQRNDLDSQKDQISSRSSIPKPPLPSPNTKPKNTLPAIQCRPRASVKKTAPASTRVSVNKRQSINANKVVIKQRVQKTQESVSKKDRNSVIDIKKHMRQHSYQGYTATDFEKITQNIKQKENIVNVIVKQTNEIDVQTDGVEFFNISVKKVEAFQVQVQTQQHQWEEQPSILLTSINPFEQVSISSQTDPSYHLPSLQLNNSTVRNGNKNGNPTIPTEISEIICPQPKLKPNPTPSFYPPHPSNPLFLPHTQSMIHSSSHFRTHDINLFVHKPYKTKRRFPSMQQQLQPLQINTQFHQPLNNNRSLDTPSSFHLSIPINSIPPLKHHSHHQPLDKKFLTATTSPKLGSVSIENQMHIMAKGLNYNNQDYNSLDNLNIKQLAEKISGEQGKGNGNVKGGENGWYYNLAKVKDKLKRLGPDYIRKRRGFDTKGDSVGKVNVKTGD